MHLDDIAEFDSELVIGLVAAIGTDLSRTHELLTERLLRAGYDVKTIRVSKDVIGTLCEVEDHGDNQYRRSRNLIDAGNRARERSKDNSVLALGAATCISALREKSTETKTTLPMEKTAFIVRSLKRPEEVDQLRRIYGDGFVLLGIHSSKERRVNRLTEHLGMSEGSAAKLCQIDGNEVNNPFGQKVNKTFHLADFFVHSSRDDDKLRCDVDRVVDLFFGNPFSTPTFDEYAMFFAFAASLRSADLSRQVGAVVAKDNHILSTGANECPKAGGGLYWPTRKEGEACISDLPNGRDYMRGEDSNKKQQNEMIESIIEKAIKEDIDADKLRKVLTQSRIADLTEFGRVVHAEMESILACSRSNLDTTGSTLYSTTFPCHNCAKHIIAAGVKRVVYIEPYPKSKALEFHDEAITESRDSDGSEKTLFEPFAGIGPRRFFDLFSMQLASGYELVRKDKKTGEKVPWDLLKSRLRIQMLPTSYLQLELSACDSFGNAKDRINSWTNGEDQS